MIPVPIVTSVATVVGGTGLVFRVPYPSVCEGWEGFGRMTENLRRRYGDGTLHFITCSCYRRLPLLGSALARDVFVKVLQETRSHYEFELIAYVVMPEHFHLLIGEPPVGTPASVMQVLKQRVSRSLREEAAWQRRFWERRFYDFNVWSRKKKIEKICYMHMNPLRRGLVAHPKDWRWSSFADYQGLPAAPVGIDLVD